MSKPKKNNTSDPATNNLGQEIWGVVFFASGLLIMISLVSHVIRPSVNILGPWFGTYLAGGLITLFGVVSSFLIPLEIMYIAVIVFKAQELPVRRLLIMGFFILEVCIVLAVHNLPIITRENFFPIPANTIGNLVTYLLHYVFGTQRFGPYFLFFVSILLTLAVMFDVNIHDILMTIWRFMQRIWRMVMVKYESLLITMKSREPPTQKLFVETDKNISKRVAAKPAAPVEPVTDDEKAAAEKILEEELAAFRAKVREPITISNPDLVAGMPEISEYTDEADGIVDIENEEDVADIGDSASIDPTLMEIDEEEFCKIPTLEQKNKPKKQYKPYIVPSPDILPDPPPAANIIDRMVFEENSRILEKTLMNFGVEGKVVNISPGPVVTRYEIELAPGVKISKVVNLHDDLSMAVGGKKIRIEAPIPGKAAVGIELPNEEMQLVYFKHILTSDVFRKGKAKLPIIIGRSISGAPYVTDITKMPHLLIAGQTGSGKSVAINSFLCSLLMTKTPDELRLILIDPKKVEMSYYENIPHLMAPVVTESKEAVKALQWGVMEMTRRYRLLAKVYARNIDSFNQKIAEKSIKEGLIPEDDNKPLPFIVIIVDELADLMLTASRDVEGLIQRIAQLARAVGIHLLVATQRPSVDIITGPIKANLTSRIGFRTIQAVDSRTILGHIGAEKLLGRGDMLFLRSGAPDIERYHGAYISEEDVEKIVAHVRAQEVETEKIESFEDIMDGGKESVSGPSSTEDGGRDEKFEEAARLIVSTGLGSTSLLQRRLKLGYARAGRLMDELHDAGVVGPQEGSKAREVLITPEVLEDMFGR